MKRLVIIGFFFLGITTAIPQNLPKLEMAFSSSISEQRLLKSVRELVLCGNRLGGSYSGDKSVEYISKNLKIAGFKVEIQEEPGHLVFDSYAWTLKVISPKKLQNVIQNEWLGGYSPSVPRTRAKLKLYKKDSIDLATIKGCLLLSQQRISPSDIAKLAEAGAVGILQMPQRYIERIAATTFVSNLKAANDNPIPLFNLSYTSGDTLKKSLMDNKEIEIAFSSRTEIHEGTTKTVIATIEGKSTDYVIVCAHGDSDSGGPGADDNASGAAGVMEMARVFKSLIQSKQLPVPEKSLKFIVWGTEMQSASYFIKQHISEIEKIRGVFNYDQIGYGETRNCIYFESNELPHNKDLMLISKQVMEEYAGKKGFWEEATTNPSQGGTDSYMFLPSSLKRLKAPEVEIPAIAVCTAAWGESRRVRQTPGWASSAWKGHPDSVVIDFAPYYHTTLDIPKLTTQREPFNMANAVKAVGIVLLRSAWK
ncbi:MAG: M28 family peptidase [bacterium]